MNLWMFVLVKTIKQIQIQLYLTGKLLWCKTKYMQLERLLPWWQLIQINNQTEEKKEEKKKKRKKKKKKKEKKRSESGFSFTPEAS